MAPTTDFFVWAEAQVLKEKDCKTIKQIGKFKPGDECRIINMRKVKDGYQLTICSKHSIFGGGKATVAVNKTDFEANFTLVD